MFQLKLISTESVPLALEKAERYRLLKQAWMAESICRDILEADPQNSKAMLTLLLAITDQFEVSQQADVSEASRLCDRLPGEYEREYYAGVISERKGKSILCRSAPDESLAYEWLYDAMLHYERAEAIRPPGNDDAILCWNTCVRLIDRFHLSPRNERYEQTQLE
jgi:hypothetical protein